MIGSSHSPPYLQGKTGTLSTGMRPASKARSSTPRWLRHCALGMSGVFAWSVLATVPAQAYAHPAPTRRPGVRVLPSSVMRQMVGAQGPPANHPASLAPDSGGTFPWEASVGGVNTGNGNKTTTLPLVAWTQRGGLPVSLSVIHNSQGNHNGELGQKWTFSYDIYLTPVSGGNGGGGGGGVAANSRTVPSEDSLDNLPLRHRRFAQCTTSVGNLAIHWGDDQSYPFTNNGQNVFAPPTGIYDSLVQNVDGTYNLTTKAQVSYHFNTALYCDRITDENGNSVTLNHNAANYVTSVVDATGRTLTFGYDASSRINSVTDPLNRVWTLAYDASNNLSQISQPLLAGQQAGQNYHVTLGYDASHDITSLTSAGSRVSTFSYNNDGSLAWEQDGAGNRTTYSYAASGTTLTDANGHTAAYNYATGRLSSEVDAQNHSVSKTYDASNNVTAVQDERGKTTTLTYDTQGNALTAADPLHNVTTYTYNSHSKPLTKTLPTGEQMAYAYDGRDNLTSVTYLDSTGAIRASESYIVDANGLMTDHGDANGHHTQYGHDPNGNLTGVTTPNSHVTAWTYDSLGAKTTRTDALSRATTYTLDAWERTTGISYPSALQNKTFTYDADGNLTQFVDATGTTTRSYDNDNRLLSESKGGSTVVSHSYDAAGKAGLLSTTTDANGRVLTYAYDSVNRMASVNEAAGTTTYGYDASSHETSIANANGTTVAKTYDDDGQLIGVVNANGAGATLSSFSYVYDTDSRRHTCTEANGDVVTYGYDYAGHLTSESRAGASAYSLSYTLDTAGNRLSQTKGGATTTFAYDNDDELLTTSSTTGGFVNTYGYNANGEQTSRTLSGTAYTLAYDYEGQITSIAQGASTTTFAYDAGGRRVSRTAGGTATNFLYDGSSILLEKQGAGTTATYTYGNALVRKDGETPLYDGQGSERTVTNAAQAVTGTLTQDGFGNTVASSGGSNSPYMYAATSGYRNDGDAGLSHVGARYYDAQVGRFISRDTELDQKPYLYCEHDPVNRLDPSGHFYVGIHLGGTAMFVLGGVTLDIHINFGSGGVSVGGGAGAGFGLGLGASGGIGIGGGEGNVPRGPSNGIGYLGFGGPFSGEVDAPGPGETPTSGYGGVGRMGGGIGLGFMWAVEAAYDL